MAPIETRSLKGQLSLKNDGDLEIFFLGVGTAFSIDDGHTNFLIIKGEDHLLVDLGVSGPQRLASVAGLDLESIRTFLPTHAHADHIGGLETLTVYNRYRSVVPGKGPKLRVVITPEFRKNLWRMTLRGGLGFNEPGMEGTDDLFDLYYDVIEPERISAPGETGRWSVSVGAITIDLIRTVHTQGGVGADGEEFFSYGLLIDDRVYYSGDTAFNPETLLKHGANVDLIIHDAGVVETPLHPTIDQLRTMPESIRRKTLLVHYPEEARKIDVEDFLGLAASGTVYSLRSRPEE